MGSKISQVIRFKNNNVMVFNEKGEQIPELQGRYEPRLKRKILRKSGTKTEFYLGDWQGGELRRIKKMDF